MEILPIFSKTIFYFLRSHLEAKCVTKVTGNKCNKGDGKGLLSHATLKSLDLGNFVSTLKQQLDSMKSL